MLLNKWLEPIRWKMQWERDAKSCSKTSLKSKWNTVMRLSDLVDYYVYDSSFNRL